MRPRQLPLLSLFVFGAAGAGASAAAGCENNPAHIFIAVQYDPVRDCLLAEETIDAVDGADRGPCAATRCWETPAGNVYVSTTACDAPPDFVDHTSDPEGSPCAKAIAALQKERCAP